MSPSAAASVEVQSAQGMSEEALIRLAQQGDEEAFEQLVHAHDQGVLRLAYNLLRSTEDAYDVYQETFLRAYRNLPTFRFDCSFHTWVYRIATNLCLDFLRRRKVRKEEPGVLESENGERSLLDNVAEQRADSDPQRALLNRELRERINKVLGDLTPRERTVFELRHFQGMRLRAIGEMLGATEEAAKNCLFRATQKMRVALGDLL
jgi:RNA polymerase sigma-70 factor (ECF subfamily)